MVLSQKLIDKGFSISDVDNSDFNIYFSISRACYEKYVDEYFGGWVDDFQLKMNTDAFNKEMCQSTFKKIFLQDELVGFFAFDELDDKIGGVMIQMLEKAQGKGVGSFYLEHLTALSNNNNKPILLQVFKSNPAKYLYEKYGFKTYDESVSHYQMRYDPTIYNENEVRL
jgi:ribosomal protein S18 acetylase RimI-like enzyme